MHPPTISAPAPSASGQPAMSFLVLLPASAHMTHNPSPRAPASASAVRHQPSPWPLTTRKSGSTVPSLKTLAGQPQPQPQFQSQSRLRHANDGQDGSPDEERVDPIVDSWAVAGRRSSLAPGMGTGTERRALKPSTSITAGGRLGAIEPSPPGTPDRSASGSPSPGDSTPPPALRPSDHAFDSYRLSSSSRAPAASASAFAGPGPGVSPASASASPTRQIPTRAPIPAGSSEAPAFGSRPSSSSTTTTAGSGARRSRRPVTAATTGVGTQAPLQRGSMALPRGTGLGMGMGGGGKNRPGWEADEIVSVLRSGGLEGMSCRLSIMCRITPLPLLAFRSPAAVSRDHAFHRSVPCQGRQGKERGDTSR